MISDKIKKVIKNPKYLFIILSYFGFFKRMDDKRYLQIVYRIRTGQDLDIDHPKSFNEKLQWLKLYDRKPEYTTMVDKYAVKKYVADIIGEQYIIPTLGVWDHFEDIDFYKLPNKFVLKCTHDSGGLVICRDKSKFNVKIAKRKITKSLKRSFFYLGREYPYKDVKPRIIAEKYMEDSGTTDLKDYKIMCFNGRVRCSFVCSERSEHLKVTFYDSDWKRMPFERHYPASKEDIPKPENYDKMVELAEILSKDIPFVRVDFYEINGHIYFGELTFYPGAGFEEFTPDKWDKVLGDWIVLPKKRM